jgi:hypothetical protein
MPTVLGLTTGGSVLVTSGNTEINIPVLSPPEDYRFFCQLNKAINCWQESIESTSFLVGLDEPAETNWYCNFLAIDQHLPNSGQVVVDAMDTSVIVPVDTEEAALFVTPTWDTESWYVVLENGTTQINFSTAPTEDSYLNYIYLPFQSAVSFAIPVTEGQTTDSFTLLNGASNVPFILCNWETAVGLSAQVSSNTVTAVFSNAAPVDAQVLLMTQFVQPQSAAPVIPTVPQQQPWVVNELSTSVFAERLIDEFPQSWTSDAAKAPGGIEYALMTAFAEQLAYISVQTLYGWQTSRLATSVGSQLDIFSEDFFGNELPRLPSEPDDHYRSRIQSLLLQPQVTRQAIVSLVKFFTGGIVRPIEPWNPSDTSYWGTDSPYIGSYWDYDSQAVPGLWGDPAMRYQGALQIQLPPAVAATCPIWGFDVGAAWDYITGVLWPTNNQFLLQEQVVELLIANIIAQGTTAWVKFVSGLVLPQTVGASFVVANALVNIPINLPTIAGLYVLYAQMSIPNPVYVSAATATGFILSLQAPTSDNTWLNYLALEGGNPASSTANVDAGAISTTVSGNFDLNMIIPQPQWLTPVYYSGRSDTGITFNFAYPPTDLTLINYLTSPINPNVGTQSIPADALSIDIVLTTDGFHVPFAVCNWNAAVGVLPNPELGIVTFSFSMPAPGDSSGEIMFLNFDIQS